MALPWLRLIDGVLGAREIARAVRNRAVDTATDARTAALEPLTGVVVGALREAFNRDSDRLELERLRLDEERRRALEAMRLEMLRQAADREISRLRFLSIVAFAGLLGSLFFVARLAGGETFARVALGTGWLCLLSALAATFAAQAHVGRLIAGAHTRTPAADLTATPGASAAPWLIVAGLGAIAIGLTTL